MTTQDALLPCPFCGGTPTVTESTSGKYMTRTIQCFGCNIARVFGHSQFKDQLNLNTNAYWNTRTHANGYLGKLPVIEGLEGAIGRMADAIDPTFDDMNLVYKAAQEYARRSK